MAYKIKKVTRVKVQINGKTKEIKCDMFKLERTLRNKSGEKYTEKEMEKMGFVKKQTKKLNPFVISKKGKILKEKKLSSRKQGLKIVKEYKK